MRLVFLSASDLQRRFRIAACSFLILYLQLVLIRWLAGEIKLFSYFKNFILMAAFFGLGLGCVRPRADGRLRWFPWAVLSLAAVCLTSTWTGLSVLFFPDAGIMQWNGSLASPQVQQLVARIAEQFPWFVSTNAMELVLVAAILAIVYAILALVVICFFELGSLLAWAFRGERPLVAYSADIAGSLIGSAAAIAAGVLGTPPAVWIAAVSAAALWLAPSGRRIGVALPLALAVSLTAAAGLAREDSRFSPYYQVTTLPTDVVPATAGTDAIKQWSLLVNHSAFQVIYDLSPRAINAYRTMGTDVWNGKLATVKLRHELPFRLAHALDDVLIVGAGSGNDVAAGLRIGARSTVAVDIDPTILAIGRDVHPEHPYQSPLVRTVNDDARAYFQRAGPTEHYDLIVYGTLDSHTAINAMSSLRLEYFVYTVESFRKARSLLKSDGLVVVAFGTSWKTWVAERMARTLRMVFDDVRVFELREEPGRMFFVGGPGLADLQPGTLASLDVVEQTSRYSSANIRPATDDWPYLYMDPDRQPWVLVTCVFLNILIGIAALRWVSRTAGSPEHPVDAWVMFFLGAGFLLIETKGVTEVALVYGSTWMVNAIVFSGILVAILLANLYVLRRHSHDARGALILLIAVLLAKYFLADGGTAAADGLAGRWLVPIIASAPAIFASVAFARVFSAAQYSSYLLGWNIVGALAGGGLELLAIFAGNHALTLVALALYAAAFAAHTVALRRRTTPELAT